MIKKLLLTSIVSFGAIVPVTTPEKAVRSFVMTEVSQPTESQFYNLGGGTVQFIKASYKFYLTQSEYLATFEKIFFSIPWWGFNANVQPTITLIDELDYIDINNYNSSYTLPLSYVMLDNLGLTNVDYNTIKYTSNVFDILANDISTDAYLVLTIPYNQSSPPGGSPFLNSVYMTTQPLQDESILQLIENAYQEGLDAGFQDGYNNGYGDGKSDGYDLGYGIGYDKGQLDDFDGFSTVLGAIFSSITAFGNIQLIPGLTLGMIIGIVVIFGLIFFILGKRDK